VPATFHNGIEQHVKFRNEEQGAFVLLLLACLETKLF
jgi:hypothetical protein